MISNMMRRAMAATSGFVGVTLDFGTLDGGYTSDLPLWWASQAGGSDNKALAENVALTALSPGATITANVIATVGPAPSVRYAINDGATTSYTTGFSVVSTDYLKVAIAAPNQISNGSGVVLIFANGTQVSAIDYVYDPA